MTVDPVQMSGAVPFPSNPTGASGRRFQLLVAGSYAAASFDRVGKDYSGYIAFDKRQVTIAG